MAVASAPFGGRFNPKPKKQRKQKHQISEGEFNWFSSGDRFPTCYFAVLLSAGPVFGVMIASRPFAESETGRGFAT